MKTNAAIGEIAAGLQAETYRATAEDRRFQALERRELRKTGRAGMLLVILVAFFGGSVLSVVHPAAPDWIVGLETGLALTAGMGYWLLGGQNQHHPELIIFVVTSAVVLECVALGLLVSELTVLATGYLLLIPVGVAQVVTWRTWTHTLWLVLYVVAVMSFLVLARVDDLSPPEKIDVAVLALVLVVVSFCAHVIGTRARIRSFRQLRTIQALHRDLAGQAAELERASRVDPLTRIANRLRLDEDFDEIRARINRTGETCGLLEADLDRFKAINDQLGHLAGDAVLRSVAQALQGALRAGDHVYRYGGEEFVVFIAGADAQATKAAAERLRAAVEALAITHPDPQIRRVTVSIGGTVIGPADMDATDGALFDRADRAMYAAKANGRNQVAIELAAWHAAPVISVAAESVA
jgi:diguanylate cyclase (GGDEF)-like protein